MEEKVIIQGLCNRVKHFYYVENGHGMLTNYRFIYSRHNLAKIVVMGLLVNLTKGDFEFDISLSNIKMVTQGRQGLSKSVFVIETINNETFKFAVTKFSKWKIAFDEALSEHQRNDNNIYNSPTDEIKNYK